MKINRSTNISMKYATPAKLASVDVILTEYGRVVNEFIDLFWGECPDKAKLLKPIVDYVDTWFGARMRKVAAREAIDMIKSATNAMDHRKETLEIAAEGCRKDALSIEPKTRMARRKIQKLHKRAKRLGDKLRDIHPSKPHHSGLRMCLSSTIAELRPAKQATEFDAWLHLSCVGNNTIIDIPVRFHKHYHELLERGQRLESYVITRKHVQLCFEIETGPKIKPKTAAGVDTGIKALASLDDGTQFGSDIEQNISRIKRCKQGSKGQQRARHSLKQRIDEVARDVASRADLIVVENLKGICNKTKAKRRLAKNMRRSLGSWNARYWLARLEARCQYNRVVFRSVPAHNTSIMCSACGHTERSNRKSESFRCRECDFSGNADVNAARNILARFLLGPYGAEFKRCLV